jgi:hypothetical protein
MYSSRYIGGNYLGRGKETGACMHPRWKRTKIIFILDNIIGKPVVVDTYVWIERYWIL